MAVRLLVSSCMAAAITFALFLFMQALIAMGDGALTERFKTGVIEFVRLKRTSEMELKRRELPKKDIPKVQPKQPAMQMTSTSNTADAVAPVNIPAPDMGHSVSLKGGLGLGPAVSDRDPVPFVRIQPLYPSRARERGIEGWVEVEFAIAPTGSVSDAKVVAASPSGVFDRSALRAVRKWKYKPQVENGTPVWKQGLRVRLAFELEES